jgi:hypothetical protein
VVFLGKHDLICELYKMNDTNSRMSNPNPSVPKRIRGSPKGSEGIMHLQRRQKVAGIEEVYALHPEGLWIRKV